MPYDIGYTQYPPKEARPDAPGNVLWLQTHLIQNYGEPTPMVVDKEIKGGLHRVKYLSQLYDYTYDGIFQERRAVGMLAYVEFKDDDTPLKKYYSLNMMPGTSANQWTEVGSGIVVTLNNPKTVATLAERDALETVALAGTATTGAGTTNVNGTGTNWAGADAEIAVGDKFRFGTTDYYFVESILNEGSLKTTTVTNAHTNETLYKIAVAAGDFVNVIDARTQAEIDGGVVEAYPASFIWDGVKWLNIYPYGENPYSHVRNTDTGLIILGSFISGDTIWNAIHNDSYRKQYNDAESLTSAAGGTNVGNNGPFAYSSKRVATELLLRPAADPINGVPTLFLNQKGNWVTPAGSGGGLGAGDIGDSDTIDFYYDQDDNKYKFAVIPSGTTIIQTDYQTLCDLRDAGELLNGVGYEFDYYTKHVIKHTSDINIGVTEKIVIFANGSLTFAAKGISRSYPQDVIEYDIDNTFAFEDGSNRPGFITYRKDINQNIETYYDFRNYKFRRWAYINETWYDSGDTYVASSDWTVLTRPLIDQNGWLYGFKGEVDKNYTRAIAGSWHDPNYQVSSNPYWHKVWRTNDSPFIVDNPVSTQVGMYTLYADPNTFMDFYTFNTSAGNGKTGNIKNISIGKHSEPNNIIFDTFSNGEIIYDNVFGVGCYNMTIISSDFNSNYLDAKSNTNIFAVFKNNTIKGITRNSIFSGNVFGNQIWNGCINVALNAFRYNTLYAGIDCWMCSTNTDSNIAYATITNTSTAPDFISNSINSAFIRNFLGSVSKSNIFVDAVRDTTVTKSLSNCTFNKEVNSVYIFGSAIGCTFKSIFFNTTVGVEAGRWNDTFNFNHVNGDMSVSDIYSSRNYFARNCSYNTFNNSVLNVGTQAIPYKTNDSIYHFAVLGLTMTTTGLSVNRTIFNQQLNPYTVVENLLDTTVPKQSPPIITSSFTEVTALIAANSGAGALETGKKYSIVYQNKHRVNAVAPAHVQIYAHPITERLVLSAVSPNKFATECFSLDYPTDVINYDINKVFCEDGTTPRPGFITYRKDTILNNETEGFCFRSTVFPRYTSVVPEYDPLKKYNYSSVVKVAANNAIYIYRHITHFTGKPVTDDVYWGKVCNINDDLLWPYTGPGLADFNRNLYQYAFMHPGGNTGDPGDSGWPYTVYNVDITTTPKLFLCFTANRADSTSPNFGYQNWKGTNCIIKNAARGVDCNNVFIATGMGTATANTGANFKNLLLDNAQYTTVWCPAYKNLYIGKDSTGNFFYHNNQADNYIGSNCSYNFCGEYFVRNNWIGNNINNNICIRLYADNTVMGYYEDCIFVGYTQGNVFGVFAGKLSWGQNNFVNTVYGERGATGHRMHAASGFSANTVLMGLTDVYVGANCISNKFSNKMTTCVLGDGVTNNTFNNPMTNSGTFAIPLLLEGTTFNYTVNNLQQLDTAAKITSGLFNVPINGLRIDAPETGALVNFYDAAIPAYLKMINTGGVVSATVFGTKI